MKTHTPSFVGKDFWFPVKTTQAFDTYWKFAAERQEVFFRRLGKECPPWTHDAVIQNYKFTNAYRASDRTSQFLIKNVIYGDEKQTQEDIFFRILIFKIFNKMETWEYLKDALGEITYSRYSFASYDKLLSSKIKQHAIYSAAYIMPSGGNCFGYSQKHQNHLKMLECMMKDLLPFKIEKSKNMQEVFMLLRSYPMIGNFLAYQYAIDINYSELTNFTEMSFVFPGPGALSGLRKCFSDFGGMSEIDLIKLVTDSQEREFAQRDIKFKSLWGRPLQLIDCQNLFCEVDKYCRVVHPELKSLQGRVKIKQKFKPTYEPVQYFYPPKWGLNEKVNKTMSTIKHNGKFFLMS